jgi:hypothetical protein
MSIAGHSYFNDRQYHHHYRFFRDRYQMYPDAGGSYKDLVDHFASGAAKNLAVGSLAQRSTHSARCPAAFGCVQWDFL